MLDSKGRIVFRTYPGMWNFDIDAWENAMRKEIERIFSINRDSVGA